ncbi:hypothetical protein [Stenotrophomonas cyclobalanopsidis]|uniref:hypothetical protein n=1 Tax=Stenotrophomonas cyclobalanopsidis TaxID=2771362 RepID=UPI00165FFB09|nr:hypothetical protein [Stenotrophomonas cyclobalanopsidis]
MNKAIAVAALSLSLALASAKASNPALDSAELIKVCDLYQCCFIDSNGYGNCVERHLEV